MSNKENMEKLIKKIRRGEVILWAGAGFLITQAFLQVTS